MSKREIVQKRILGNYLFSKEDKQTLLSYVKVKQGCAENIKV